MRVIKACLCVLSLLVPCSCASRRYWRVQHADARIGEFDSSRLIYSSTYLDLEFLRIGNAVDCFLIVKGNLLPIHSKDLQETILKIDTLPIPLTCHAGGQKLSFTEEAQKILLQRLERNSPFQLELGDYAMTVNPEGFEDSYKAFSRTPFFRPNSLHLGF